MGHVITASFGGNQYVACYTAFDPPFRQQIDVARIGFRPHNGENTIVVFPTRGKALEWGAIWFRRNKRVMPSLNTSFFTAREVTVGLVT